MSAESEDKLVIAGFWRRIIAFLLDALILGFIGKIIGILFYTSLVHIGAPARLIGFAVALAYFGVFNSHVGDGQTPAKRWLGVCVVDAHGEPLSLPRALARCAVFGTPFFLNGLPLPASMPFIISLLQMLAVFGGSFAILYLYVFNRTTRQSLHDFAARSYVVRVESEGSEAHFPPVWRGHWVAISLFALLVLAAQTAFWRFSQAGLLAGLMPIYQTVQAQPHVIYASVDRDSTSFSDRPATYSLSASIRLDEPLADDSEYARNIGHLLVKQDPLLSQEQAVTVALFYGFDIGIASGGKTHIYKFAPDELR